MKRRVRFRADGSSTIGLGHIIRSLALVEMLKQDFECIFMIREPGKKIAELISSYCNFNILPDDKSLQEEVNDLKKLLDKDDILVLDGYDFDGQYQLELKPVVYKMVAIDDKASVHFYADLIINHGSALMKNIYKRESYSKLLLGFPYLLIRKPFREAAKQNRTLGPLQTLFLCMGGADPFNVANKILKSAIQCDFIKKIILVTGSAYQYLEDLRDTIGRSSKKIIHEQNVNAEKMVELISKCEIAVCSSSAVALEVCCVKAGLLTGIVINNQQGLHDQLINAGCAITLGDFNAAGEEDLIRHIYQLNNLTEVQGMMDNQSKAIDGLSGERLLNEFKVLAEC